MRNAIVYFSLDGNCKYVAEQLVNNLEGETELIPLEPIKEYPKEGFKKMFFCGFDAIRKKKEPIKGLNFNPKDYDNVILGTPVWAGNMAPPLRTFFLNNYIIDKRVFLFACSSSGDADKVFSQIRYALEGCNISEKTLSLKDPYINRNSDTANLINAFSECINKSDK